MEKFTSKDLKTLLNFLEEFSWVANKYKNIDAKKVLELVNQAEASKIDDVNFTKDKNYRKDNFRDKRFLIGALPELLMDKELFQKNRDLSDFALLMGIEVKFPEKRSRDEIIGTIICSLQEEVNNLKISDIGDFIYKLTSDEKIITNIKIEKKYYHDSYDWNRVIRNLYTKR